MPEDTLLFFSLKYRIIAISFLKLFLYLREVSIQFQRKPSTFLFVSTISTIRTCLDYLPINFHST